MPKPDYVYWDSCIFISQLNGDATRTPDIAGVLQEIDDSHGGRKIATSAVSKVEVAFASGERSGQSLDPAVEKKIDDMWADDTHMEMVDLHEYISRKARDLIRQCVAEGKPPIKPLDAIHVATAQWLGATELHTYDDRLLKCQRIGSLTICKPHALMPRLPGIS